MTRFKIFAFAFIATVLAACSGEEGFEITDDGIKVVTSQTEIASGGGQGTVTVNKTVSNAYSSESWLTVSTNGSTVNITATKNDCRESRAAKLVVKASAEDSVIVAVKQNGLVFTLGEKEAYHVGDAAVSQTLEGVQGSSIKTVSCPSWITPVITSDGITLDIAENTTGHIRSGEVEFSCEGYEESVYVLQGEPKDIEGQYYFLGYNSNYKLTYLNAKVTCTSDSITVTFTDLNWKYSLPLQEGLMHNLPSKTKVGTYTASGTKYYVGIFLWAPFDGYISTSKTVTYTCAFYYDDDYETTIGEFDDNGSWSSYAVDGMIFYGCSTSTLATRKITIFKFIYPYLMKVGELGAKPAQLPAKLAGAQPLVFE